MIVRIVAVANMQVAQSNFVKISQPTDEIMIMNNHENIIYAITDGKISIDSGESWDVSNGVCYVNAGECTVLI